MNEQPENGSDTSADILNKSLPTIGDYINQYQLMHQEIVSMKTQAKILDAYRKWYATCFFDQYIERMKRSFDKQVEEIGPVVLILSKAISWLVPEKDRKYLSKYVFERQSIHELAIQYDDTDRYIAGAIYKASMIEVPNEMVEEYGEIFKK